MFNILVKWIFYAFFSSGQHEKYCFIFQKREKVCLTDKKFDLRTKRKELFSNDPKIIRQTDKKKFCRKEDKKNCAKAKLSFCFWDFFILRWNKSLEKIFINFYWGEREAKISQNRSKVSYEFTYKQKFLVVFCGCCWMNKRHVW